MSGPREYYFREHLCRKTPQSYVKEIQSYLKGCGKVLDVGCGNGTFMKPGWQGIDSDETAVKICKERGFDVKKADATNIPYPDNNFDGILCLEMLEHLQNPLGAALEMRRVLKSDGVFVVSVPLRCNLYYSDYTHVRPFTKYSLNMLLRDAGFMPVKFTWLSEGIPGFGVLGLYGITRTLASLGIRRGGILCVARKSQ